MYDLGGNFVNNSIISIMIDLNSNEKLRDIIQEQISLNTPFDNINASLFVMRTFDIPASRKTNTLTFQYRYFILLVNHDFQNNGLGIHIFDKKVSEIMEERFPIVSPDTDVNNLFRIIGSGYQAVLIMSNNKFKGLISKIDLVGFSGQHKTQ